MAKKVEFKKGIKKENKKILLNDPLIKRLGDDINDFSLPEYGNNDYYSVYVDGFFVGAFVLIHKTMLEIELGTLLLKKAAKHSKDITTNFLNYVFNKHNITRITGWIHEWNIMAINHCLKYGSKIEGIKRQALLENGKLTSLVLLGLTRNDWLHQKWAKEVQKNE